MSDPQPVVDQAIYTRLSGDATLLALATGGVWQALTAEGTATPYVQYQQYGEAESPWTFGNPQPYTLFEYQIRAVTNQDVSFVLAQSILSRVYVLLSDYALPVSGYSTMVCRRSRIGQPTIAGELAGIPVLTIAHNYEIGVS